MVNEVLEGGKKRKMRGGQDLARLQTGGAPTPLTPASLSGVSFDQMGNQLANKAHNLYVQKNYELAALKNVNAMKGGIPSPGGSPNFGGRRSRRTAKKYSRSKSRNKRSNKRNAKRRGGGLVEAAVPLGLLAAQQTLFKKGSSKRYNKYGGQMTADRPENPMF